MVEYILGSFGRDQSIIGPPYQNDVDQAHANKQGYDAAQDDPVLAKELIVANQSTKDPEKDDYQRATGAPPAVK